MVLQVLSGQYLNGFLLLYGHADSQTFIEAAMTAHAFTRYLDGSTLIAAESHTEFTEDGQCLTDTTTPQ